MCDYVTTPIWALIDCSYWTFCQPYRVLAASTQEYSCAFVGFPPSYHDAAPPSHWPDRLVSSRIPHGLPNLFSSSCTSLSVFEAFQTLFFRTILWPRAISTKCIRCLLHGSAIRFLRVWSPFWKPADSLAPNTSISQSSVTRSYVSHFLQQRLSILGGACKLGPLIFCRNLNRRNQRSHNYMQRESVISSFIFLIASKSAW